MRSKEDASLLIRFFKTMERNVLRSEKTGKAEFDEVELISIRVPGSRDEHVALVNDEYRERFKDEYRAWKDNDGAPITGVPLTEWPAATTSFVDEMKLLGIRTVEELSSISDGHAMAVPGLQTMKARAIAWLGEQDASSALKKAEDEKAELLERIAQLEALVKGAGQPKTKKAAAPVVDPATLTDEELEAMTNPAPAA